MGQQMSRKILMLRFFGTLFSKTAFMSPRGWIPPLSKTLMFSIRKRCMPSPCLDEVILLVWLPKGRFYFYITWPLKVFLISTPLRLIIWVRLLVRPPEAFRWRVWLTKLASSLVLSLIWPRTMLLRGGVELIWIPLCIKAWFTWMEAPTRWWSVTRPFSTCLILERWEFMFLIIGSTKQASPLQVTHPRKMWAL